MLYVESKYFFPKPYIAPPHQIQYRCTLGDSVGWKEEGKSVVHKVRIFIEYPVYVPTSEWGLSQSLR
jgi:hypothetical protein